MSMTISELLDGIEHAQTYDRTTVFDRAGSLVEVEQHLNDIIRAAKGLYDMPRVKEQILQELLDEIARLETEEPELREPGQLFNKLVEAKDLREYLGRTHWPEWLNREPPT